MLIEVMLIQLLFGMKLLSAEIQQSGTSKEGILGHLPNDIKKEMKRTKETVILPIMRAPNSDGIYSNIILFFYSF